MNNRKQKITNKVLLKSSGNFKKIAQQSELAEMQQESMQQMNKQKALAFMQAGRFDRLPVAGAGSGYFESLDPTEKLQVINYWKDRITKGPNREDAAKNFIGLWDISQQEAAGIKEIGMRGGFESRLAFLDKLASRINSKIQAGGAAGAGAAASQGGGGSPKAQGPQQEARSPYDPNVPLGAGPEGKKPAPAPAPGATPSSTGGGKDDVASKPPPSQAGSGGQAGGGGQASVSTPATPGNTQLPPASSSASNVRQPNYFFPDGKQANIEGYYGPYAAPDGKKRYFKVVFDKSAKRYSYTGEFEDR